MRAATFVLITVAFLAGSAAHADRGALAAEVSAGVTVESVRLASSFGSASQVGTAASVSLAGWYALTDSFELGVRAFWEPSASWVHENATSGAFTGSLTSNSTRFGGMAGARFTYGLVWQLSVGLSAGVSERMFSNLNLYDVSGTSPRNFGLRLADFSTTSFVAAPSVGLKWGGDHVAVGIETRVEMLFGPGVTWAVTVPLSVSWSWYL